jgi:NTE family protein
MATSISSSSGLPVARLVAAHDLEVGGAALGALPVDPEPKSEGDQRPPQDGTALCLSGGGYRAMLFHVGALWRLNELGLLPSLNRVSSVSGGSITAAQLAIKWRSLAFDSNGVAVGFADQVVQPIRRLAGVTLDWKALVGGVLSRGTIAEKIAGAYRKHLFGDATLQDIPDEKAGSAPRFVFNASNVQSGVLWRFSKPYMRDYRVGCVPKPTIPLAVAVAASSAFPPFLSPLTLKLDPTAYQPKDTESLHYPPFTTRPVLTDGGVYDNLGLETAWKRYRTVWVSDGGGRYTAEAKPKSDWGRHIARVFSMVDSQVRSLRKRQVVGAYRLPKDQGILWRDGAYWGVWTDISEYHAEGALPCPVAATSRLAAEPTRLAAIKVLTQERIINWGYAVCDAAVRTFGGVDHGSPPTFPYPAAGVG